MAGGRLQTGIFMKLHSDSFGHGHPLPPGLAMGTPEGFGGNRNPHLAWSEAPQGTRSFVLLCIDPDVPTVKEMVGKAGVEIPVEQPRTDFIHWTMADIPADVNEIAEGAWSGGATVGGKNKPLGPHPASHGLNDYTGWFAGDATMAGDYRGYDGPYPPANDRRMHRYFFRLFALDVESMDLAERFSAGDVLRAMQGHVLAEALTYGTYSLHAAVSKSPMSTMAYLLWGLVFGSIGTGYFMYGKKRPNAMAMLSGLALMVYPYFIGSTWAMILIGVLLMAIPFFVGR
jgi:Raf kinase inhibitor-like YbhB/YbcL family protein